MGAGSHWHWALERAALLINQNQPRAITSIFWVNYREGQVAQAGFRMRLRACRRNICWYKRVNKCSRMDPVEGSSPPGYLQACGNWRQTAAVPLIVPRQQQYSVNATPLTVQEPATPLFQLQKMKTPGNAETIRGQDYDLWLLLCQGEKKKSNNKIHPLAHHKNLFPKVSIQ